MGDYEQFLLGDSFFLCAGSLCKYVRTTQTLGCRSPVKGFSTVDGMALLNVEGAGMIGVPGVAHRLFGALREVGVSVVMISQASSEHSICFAVPEAQAQKAKETVEEAFFHEMHHNKIQTIDVVAPCSMDLHICIGLSLCG